MMEPAEEYIHWLVASGWTVTVHPIATDASDGKRYTIAVEGHGYRFIYRGRSLAVTLARAWAGETPDLRHSSVADDEQV